MIPYLYNWWNDQYDKSSWNKSLTFICLMITSLENKTRRFPLFFKAKINENKNYNKEIQWIPFWQYNIQPLPWKQVKLLHKSFKKYFKIYCRAGKKIRFHRHKRNESESTWEGSEIQSPNFPEGICKSLVTSSILIAMHITRNTR